MSHNLRGSKAWALPFILVPIFVIAVFVMSLKEWWLPVGASTYSGDVDGLFYLILWITGIGFVGTNVLLCWTLLTTKREGKATYTHGNHTLELIWTIIPAILLVFLALYQRDTWAQIKQQTPENPALSMKVIARQFEWTGLYAGPNGVIDTKDIKVVAGAIQTEGDDFTSAKLYVPAKSDVVVDLTSLDVLHSFFLPQARLKQDAVPGMNIKQWFHLTKTSTEYAKENNIRERLLDTLIAREGVKVSAEQKKLLTALVTCLEGDPYSRESRKMYKALEKTTKAAYGDDEGFA
ncbi:MAG: cytochrome c oxidase subunit II transmembrane domain-containing protein, partial [Planctomycetota bacterium]